MNTTTGELEYASGTGERNRFTKTSGGSTGAATYLAKSFDATLSRLSGGGYELLMRDRRMLSFNSSGQLTQIKPRFLAATTLSYASGKLSSITDSAGRAISITYYATTPALIERVTLPDSRYVEYGYISGRLTSVRDARGKSWTLAYDATSGYLTSIEDPVGRYELQAVVYDGQGRVTSEEDGAGEAITYSYSTSSPYKLTTVTYPGRGSWVYKHLANLLISVTDPLNRVTSFSYDGYGRTATETDGRGNTWRYHYDAAGNPIKEVAPSPAGFTIERTYSSSNDLLTEKDGRGNDKVTNRTQEIRAGSVGNTGTIDYSYNSADQLTQTSKGGVNTSYSYDANGNQASAGSRSYSYDLASRLASTSLSGTTTTYGYDGDGRRISSTTGSGADLRYAWDPLAASGIPELALERDASGTLIRRYLEGPTDALGYSTSGGTYWYHHDPLNTISDVTDQSGTAQWRYEYEPYGAERTATNVFGSAAENRFRFNSQYLDPETSSTTCVPVSMTPPPALLAASIQSRVRSRPRMPVATPT